MGSHIGSRPLIYSFRWSGHWTVACRKTGGLLDFAAHARALFHRFLYTYDWFIHFFIMNVTFERLIKRFHLVLCAWILYSYCFKFITVFITGKSFTIRHVPLCTDVKYPTQITCHFAICHSGSRAILNSLSASSPARGVDFSNWLGGPNPKHG